MAKFGDLIKEIDINELDGTVMYGDDNGVAIVHGDDGMEGRLDIVVGERKGGKTYGLVKCCLNVGMEEILIIARAKCVAYNMLKYSPEFESGYNMLFSEVWKCLKEES